MDVRLVVLVTGLTAILSFAAALPMDHDWDGATTVTEWRAGSNGLRADTDGDGLVDGWEIQQGLAPTRADGDGDGLEDGWEIVHRTDPRDGDMDDDGVLDGDEGARICTIRPDCDGDGLADADELDGFDALDPDSFDAGLADAVVAVFAAAGQAPSGDDDQDGIPDAWEGNDGLITWGAFAPRAGQRDLLVEFLRVQGPDSGRFALDFRPAYDAVVRMFAGAGITLQWTETIVDLAAEHRPAFLDTDAIGYYDDVLARGAASSNPFVTSIVLNPQQEQEDLAGDVLGAAFLRSMIATVDYGAHASVRFAQAGSDGLTFDGELEIRPVIESHIAGARIEQVRQLQRAGAIIRMGVDDGTAFYVVPDDDLGPLRWEWQLDWFANGPVVTTEDGKWLRFRALDARIDASGLAATIAHELGHTLGLCHAHDAACYQDFSYEDAVARHDSTMSYGAADGTLHFLDSEWQQVDAYLTCPPQEPVRLVALGADDATIRQAKYRDSFVAALELRACSDFTPVPGDMERDGQPLGIGPAATRNPAPWVILHAAVSIGGAGLIIWRQTRNLPTS